MSVLGPIIKVVNSLLPQNPALREGYDESWYFSPDGKSAYESLSTPCEKTKFFLNYLRSVEQKDNSDSVDLLYKIAFVMASSMVDSKLQFGGYPNILDESKNPFVAYVKSTKICYYSYDPEKYCLELLNLLHDSTNENSDQSDVMFGLLTFDDSNEDHSDMYKIERDIITIFDYFFWLRIKDDLVNPYSLMFDHITETYLTEFNTIAEEVADELTEGEDIYG